MKKLLVVLLILAMVFTFAACGGGSSSGGDEGPGAVTVEDEVKQAEIRQAISLLFDRNYICEEIGQAGQVPANTFVAMGMTDADGSQFYQNANGGQGYYSVDPDAFEANVTEAIEILNEGIASAEDIDTAMKLGCNHHMGPLELGDFIGMSPLWVIVSITVMGGLLGVFGISGFSDFQKQFAGAQPVFRHDALQLVHERGIKQIHT